MPFGLDTSHIPNIPGLVGLESNATSSISSSQKNLIDSVSTKSKSVLFQNPVALAVTGLEQTIENFNELLTEISTGQIANPNITSADANNLLISANTLSGSVGIFNTHTLRLAGVLESVGVDEPGLDQIITIGQQMNRMANAIDGAKGCLNIIGGMTGLFSEEDLNAANDQINNAFARINAGLATASEVAATLLNIKNGIDRIVNLDKTFVQNSVTQLKNAALAFTIGEIMKDPCGNFIMRTVGNEILNDL